MGIREKNMPAARPDAGTPSAHRPVADRLKRWGHNSRLMAAAAVLAVPGVYLATAANTGDPGGGGPGQANLDCEFSGLHVSKTLINGNGRPHYVIEAQVDAFCQTPPQRYDAELTLRQARRAHVSAPREWTNIASVRHTTAPTQVEERYTADVGCRPGRFDAILVFSGRSHTGQEQAPQTITSDELRVASCKV